MANHGKKRTAGKKRVTRKKSSARNNRRPMSDTKKEIIIIATAGFLLLWLLGNFGLLGRGGRFLSGIFFGLIGFPAYFMPVIMFPVIIFVIVNQGKNMRLKYAAFAGSLITFSAFLEIFYLTAGHGFSDAWIRAFHEHNGGGITGWLLAAPLAALMTRFGAALIIVVISGICAIVWSETFFMLQFMRKLREKWSGRKDRSVKKMHISEKKRMGSIARESAVVPAVTPEVDHPSTVDFTERLDDLLPGEDRKELLSGEDMIPGPVRTREETSPVVPDKPAARRTQLKRGGAPEKEKTVIQPLTAFQGGQTDYIFPKTDLLHPIPERAADDTQHLRALAIRLKQTLDSFGVKAEIDDISRGPAVTRFEIVPDIGVKVSKIVGLADDIKLNLAAKDIRIEAPIPGKAAIGIEVPNRENTMVTLRSLVESPAFKRAKSKLSFCVGLDIGGKPVISDIAKMPHALIAGATGSGKSVCINTLIMSVLFKATPDEVKMIMIDPKVVELSVYNGIPHLLIPVVTDPKKAAGALNWAVVEMENRYKKFASLAVKDIAGYNEAVHKLDEEERGEHIRLPQILIIIDELADLMMVASTEVEAAICRLAQLARACGIHLVIATQRPSVNVITGLIKANIPSRIAFAVSSGVDSRTILDMNGAEKLLGKGDMLFHPAGLPKPVRVQGAFVDEEEVAAVVDAIAVTKTEDVYTDKVAEQITETTATGITDMNRERDDYFEEAARMIVEKERASIGLLQRLLRIGFNRAARIMDQLAEAGIVGPDEGTKPRKILVDKERLEALLKNE
ncbi:MAG: DNA translocase FtsK 4TM domain-containing protein [Eubacteriales bacterium]|nr:DNA translocase FtsK 4TM domain-containing protein [Eubacteriales bacterium]